VIPVKVGASQIAPPGGTSRQKPRHVKGIAAQIRERTDDLREQVSEAIRISLDARHRDQFRAIVWLAERAFGRVPEISAFAELDQAEATAALQGLSTGQLESLARAVEQKRLGLSAGSQTEPDSELSARDDNTVALVSR
jgi:uncharacterized protein (DUF2342 family)